MPEQDDFTSVIILTESYRVTGNVALRPGASRLTDYIIEAKEFIAVVEAEVRDLVLCSQSLFRFADLGDDGLCRGDPDKGCGVIVSAIDVVVDRLD